MKNVESDANQVTGGLSFDFDERAKECKFLTSAEAEERNAETKRMCEEFERIHPKPKKDEYNPEIHKPREPLPREAAFVSDIGGSETSHFKAPESAADGLPQKKLNARRKTWTVPGKDKIPIPGRRPINLEVTTWVPAY